MAQTYILPSRFYVPNFLNPSSQCHAMQRVSRFDRFRAPARRLECLLANRFKMVTHLPAALNTAHTERVCGLSSFCANSTTATSADICARMTD